MSDRPLDHWRDRMVAALCGELDETERQELERALVADDELRCDWQELAEARAALDTIRNEDDAPQPRFELPPLAPGDGRGHGVWRWFGAAAAGFLGAALLFGGLLLGGLRVDRTPDGLFVALGHETVLNQRLQAEAQRTLAQEQQQYLTRDEFMSLARTLVGATAARLDELERRQSANQTGTARLLYQALASRQQRQYNDLRARLQVASLRSTGATRRVPPAALPDNPSYRR